jgi:hypothetical protein
MAGLRFVAPNSANVALAAATAKTVLQINAPTNQRVKVTRIGIFFDGASTTAVPVLIRLMVATTAGTATALTLNKIVSSDSETIQTTATENASAEPTKTTLLDEWLIHPQQGGDFTLAMGQEFWCLGGQRLALEVTAPAVVNTRCKLFCEE